MNKSFDYYANRISMLALTNPDVNIEDSDEYEEFVKEISQRLCLDGDEVWSSVEKFEEVSKLAEK